MQAQCRSLKSLLSKQFDGPSFFTLALLRADALPLLEVMQLLQLADDAGCWRITFSTGTICSPQWIEAPHTTSLLPNIHLAHLQFLRIHHGYLMGPHWTSLFHHLTAPKLQGLRLAGRPELRDLFLFLSNNGHISEFEIAPMPGQHSCISRSAIPPEPIQMQSLSLLVGPPCHIYPVLLCLEQCSQPISIEFQADYHLKYLQYTQAVLQSLSIWGTYGSIELYLQPRYYAEDSLQLNAQDIENLAGDAPAISSFLICFPPMADPQSIQVSLCSSCSIFI